MKTHRHSPSLRPLLATACLLSTLLVPHDSAAAAPTAAGLSKQAVLDAVQRGVLGRLPAHLVVSDVQFSESARVDTELTIQGEATFTALEDSYVGTRRMGLTRPSGPLNVTIVRLTRSAKERFTAPFQAVVSLLDPSPRIAPRVDIAGQGLPLPNFKAPVIEGSVSHQQLLELDRAFSTSDERFQRVKDKWVRLQKLGELLANYDEFTGKKWTAYEVTQLLTKALDSSELAKTCHERVYKKKFTERHAQHATFVALVKPAFDPEYARIKQLFDTRDSALRSYIDFMEKL